MKTLGAFCIALTFFLFMSAFFGQIAIGHHLHPIGAWDYALWAILSMAALSGAVVIFDACNN